MYARNVIHVIANCRDCDWDCQYKDDAQEQGLRHAKENGHYVSVEVAIGVTYDYRNKKPRKSKAKGEQA